MFTDGVAKFPIKIRLSRPFIATAFLTAQPSTTIMEFPQRSSFGENCSFGPTGPVWLVSLKCGRRPMAAVWRS